MSVPDLFRLPKATATCGLHLVVDGPDVEARIRVLRMEQPTACEVVWLGGDYSITFDQIFPRLLRCPTAAINLIVVVPAAERMLRVRGPQFLHVIREARHMGIQYVLGFTRGCTPPRSLFEQARTDWISPMTPERN